MNTLGERLNKLRKSEGFTLEGLAEASGCSKSYIWELENKAPPRPSAEKLLSLAKALGVTIDYFIDAEANEEDAADAHFYREYRSKPPETKEKIRKMIELWDDE